MNQFVGIDPGGKSAMGWCVLTVQDGAAGLISGTCTGVEDCMNHLAAHIACPPAAVGIDAPLYWTIDGDRVSDKWIRKAVTKADGRSGTVSHVNSLRGACLVQGVLAAVAVVQRWPLARVTEAHPKALRLVWPGAETFVSQQVFATEHERDAALAAYAAEAYFAQSPGWVDWVAREKNPFVPGGQPVAYWFPECA